MTTSKYRERDWLGQRFSRRAATLGLLASLALVGAARAQGARPAPPRNPCAGTVSSDVVTGVGPGLELQLASGRRLRLVDTRVPDRPAPGSAGAGEAWFRALPGTAVTVTLVSATADRWGRFPARVAASGEPALDIAELLVGEGSALVDAGERDELCDSGLLRVESGARRRSLGLWADPGQVLEATQVEALAGAAGRFVVVEGTVISVGERRDRTYLNFGRDFSRDFSVVIPARRWSAFKARGLTAESLRNRRVRVRGMLEVRRAPSMEIAGPDMLELAEEEARRN